MIEIRNLTKQYESGTPLRNVSVTINKGDVISVIGPSGTGKSTLIRCINLLERPTSGEIIFNGDEITAKGYDAKKVRKQIGMVFQSFNLFEHLTVIENVMIPQMDLLKKGKQEAYDKGVELLNRVGLADKLLSYPDALSGGQKQRVAIARTLAMDPEVILFDEPTSALDPTLVAEVEAVIRELSQEGRTMMIVTHELDFARAISNRVFYMDDGGIYEEGLPDERFDHPKRELTQRFIHSLKVFKEDVTGKSHDFIGMGSRLDSYLAKNTVSPVVKYLIRLTIEELVQQILIPESDWPCIHVTVEYSHKTFACDVIVSYEGKKFDIRDTENKLALTMLENTAQQINYSFDEETKTNLVEVRIKEA